MTREGSWKESGAGSANLTYESQVDFRAQSHLGVGFAKTLNLGEGFALTPSVEGWSQGARDHACRIGGKLEF
ncbi:MAG: hypothetical protein K9H25_04130 [Rhodospirillum sp.]|nr:hypothetical protein [Rhodospirillum sp.]MCF8488861.1 hypothetical protein [Rhodospirillum sp.]MCF8502928.1 hypothetical protein [Rhodospirillum sp.]